MTDREKEILELIKKNPMISQLEIAELLNITRSSVGVHITNLMKKGYLLGKGYVVSDNYAVVVGASNVDIFGSVDNMIMHDSNIGEISTSLGGVGRNIAENIGLLGIDVKLLSIVGNDIYGKKILDETTRVDLTNVIQSNERTGVYLSIGNEMVTAINDMLINNSIDIETIQKHHSLLEHAKVIVLDTNFKTEVLEYITRQYQHKHIILDTVSMTKGQKVKDFIGRFHTVKPNRLETEMLTGVEVQNEKDAERAAAILHQKGVQEVFITLGEQGVYYSGKSKGWVRPEVVVPVNATGAGDAFVAGLVYGYMNARTIQETATLATKCSRIALMSKDTINKNLSKELIEVDYVNNK